MSKELEGKLSLIVDTNLFLECRPVSQLPWDELGAAEIELIVTRPVQQELDSHKKNDRGRTFKKALAATKLLRELVTSELSALIIREKEPRVILSIMPASRIQPGLNEALDPSFNDDAIILRMLQYQLENKAANVQLITHDTGPMTTAASLKVPYIPIPDSWLLREQDDVATKQVSRLKEELERLRSQEPQLKIKFFDEAANEVFRLDVEVATYDPLTVDQVDTLLSDIRTQVPIATEFGSAETTPKPRQFPALQRLRGATITEFEPASPREIEKYQDEAYPGWISSCRSSLQNLHTQLNAGVRWPEVDFLITNSGTRPASRALIRFLTKGNAKIVPTDQPGAEGVSLKSPEIDKVTLPKPPLPPRGVWKETPQFSSGILGLMAEGRFRDPFSSSIHHELFKPDRTHIVSPPDPDGFYWKGGRPFTGQSVVELTCENWRHGIAPESFSFRVVGSDNENTSAAIRCEVHAENLTDPAIAVLPVSIKRVAKSTFEHAQMLIAQMLAL